MTGALRWMALILPLAMLAGPAQGESQGADRQPAFDFCAMMPMLCRDPAGHGGPPGADRPSTPGPAPEAALIDICTLCQCCADSLDTGDAPGASAPAPGRSF